VPVRKPGINNGEIFNVNGNNSTTTGADQHPPQKQHLNHKTLSVPNLFQLAPPAVVTIKNNSTAISTSNNPNRMVPLAPAPPVPPNNLIPVAPPPVPLPLSIPSTQNFQYLNNSNNQKSHIYSAPITNSTLIGGMKNKKLKTFEFFFNDNKYYFFSEKILSHRTQPKPMTTRISTRV